MEPDTCPICIQTSAEHTVHGVRDKAHVVPRVAHNRPMHQPSPVEANQSASSKPGLSIWLLFAMYVKGKCQMLTLWSKVPKLQRSAFCAGLHEGTSKVQSIEVLDAMECRACFRSQSPCDSYEPSSSNPHYKGTLGSSHPCHALRCCGRNHLLPFHFWAGLAGSVWVSLRRSLLFAQFLRIRSLLCTGDTKALP